MKNRKQGWEVKTIGDVCFSASSNVAKNKLKNDDGEYPIFGASGLIKNVSFYHQNKPYLSIVKDGSGFGRVTKMNAFSSVIGTLQYILPKDEIDLDYLNYSLMMVNFKKYVAGATIPHIYFKDYKKELFLWMPLEEQKQIVAILDKAFKAIDKAKKAAQKNLKNAKELFDSYSQEIFENKEGTDWKKKELGDVCSLYQGLAINAKTKQCLVEKSNLPLLRIKDLRNNTEEQYIDPENYPINSLVNESDIIYTRTGNSLGLVFRGRKGVLHNNSFKIIPNDKLDRNYLFVWLQNPSFKSKIFSLASKAAQPDITHKIFKIQKILIPPLKEQNKIVNRLNALQEKTKKLEATYQQKLTQLEELKKSILQKAFNGELETTKGVMA
jgi:type I restriction enzyme S subunit